MGANLCPQGRSPHRVPAAELAGSSAEWLRDFPDAPPVRTRQRFRQMSKPLHRFPVTIFGPDPLLSVTIEPSGATDEVHIHPAGQGVWVARMAGGVGAWGIPC